MSLDTSTDYGGFLQPPIPSPERVSSDSELTRLSSKSKSITKSTTTYLYQSLKDGPRSTDDLFNPTKLTKSRINMLKNSRFELNAKFLNESMYSTLEQLKYIKTATVLSSSINLANVNIGVGTVGLAFGISQSGWLLGIVLFVLCHSLNHITMYFMMEIACTMPVSTYAIVCNRCRVPILQIISDWSMICNKLLSCSAYLILIGDYMALVAPQIISGYADDHLLYDRRSWIGIWLVLFIIPCTCLRKVDPLKYTSLFALTCFVYLLIMVLYYKFGPLRNYETNTSILPQPESPLAFFRTISLYLYAYGGHPIAFAVTTELINPTMKRLNTIIWNFCSFSTFIFATVAFGGYFTFGEDTDGNLLLNYPNEDVLIMIGRIGLAFAVGFTYPLLANVIKNSLGSVIYGLGIRNDRYSFYALLCGAHAPGDHSAHKDVTMISLKKYIPLVVIVVVVTVFISMATNDLALLFQFNGATFGTFNQVLFPAIIYVFACKNEVVPSNEDGSRSLKYYIAWGVIALGTVLIPFMVFYAFDSALGII
eukprot:918390_1